jgi:hypothetical protein
MSYSVLMSPNHLPKLKKDADRIVRADERFFARRPERKHRLRIAYQAEIDQLRDGEPPPPVEPGFRAFTIVRVVADGVRTRLFVMLPDQFETDLSEDECRYIFFVRATPSYWEMEARVRKTAEEEDARKI